MKILGYSERGIINSLIFSIGENKKLMNNFIKLINIPELKQAEDYTLLLEQSFSRFGDADLVIILHYKKPEQNKVLFIEGKVKTYQKKSWSLQVQFDKFNKKDKYNGYSSNLFFQLSLKKLLMEYSVNYKRIEDVEEIGIEEPRFGDFRKIGNNKIVYKAFELLKNSKAFYVGLIPSSKQEIKDFKLENNNTGLHFIAWETVYEFCKKKEKLKKVKKIFKYNKGQIY